MEKIRNDLDRGYTNVIDDFRQEQNHFQKRVDLLKEQLHEAQRTIELLKNQFELLKQNNVNDQQFREMHERFESIGSSKFTERSFRLLQERTIFLRKESDYQERISSLQVKIAEILKKPFEERVHHLRDLNVARPRSFPEATRVECSCSFLFSRLHAFTRVDSSTGTCHSSTVALDPLRLLVQFRETSFECQKTVVVRPVERKVNILSLSLLSSSNRICILICRCCSANGFSRQFIDDADFY